MARKGIDEPEPKIVLSKHVDGSPTSHEPRATSHEQEAPVTHGPYKAWKTSARYQSAKIRDSESWAKLRQQMEEIISTEGPVCESVIRRRLCKVWNVTRVTDAVERAIESALPSIGFVTQRGMERVFWAPGQKPESWRAYRVPGKDEASSSAIDEIPPEEVANAMREILADLGSCPQDALYRETMKTFGLASVTPKAREFLDVAYGLLA